jgi:hypothetical protein
MGTGVSEEYITSIFRVKISEARNKGVAGGWIRLILGLEYGGDMNL